MIKRSDHFVEFDDFKDHSLMSFLDYLQSLKGIELSELKVKDLSFFNGKIVTPGEGVYMFRKGKRVVYVGKVSSMSFTERIAKHFDVRTFAWFNRLLQIINWHILENKFTPEFYTSSSEYAFEHLNIILINMQSRDRINKLETILRATTNTLNGFKHKKNFDLDCQLKDI